MLSKGSDGTSVVIKSFRTSGEEVGNQLVVHIHKPICTGIYYNSKKSYPHTIVYTWYKIHKQYTHNSSKALTSCRC